MNANRSHFNHAEIVGDSMLKSVTQYIHIYRSKLLSSTLAFRSGLHRTEITKRCSDCWIYRDTSVKMRFRSVRLIATKFTSIKSPTWITAKIYCRAKRRVPRLTARMILLIIIAISVLLIAIIDCIMLNAPPMTRTLTLPEAWPVCVT